MPDVHIAGRLAAWCSARPALRVGCVLSGVVSPATAASFHGGHRRPTARMMR